MKTQLDIINELFETNSFKIDGVDVIAIINRVDKSIKNDKSFKIYDDNKSDKNHNYHIYNMRHGDECTFIDMITKIEPATIEAGRVSVNFCGTLIAKSNLKMVDESPELYVELDEDLKSIIYKNMIDLKEINNE